MMAGSWGNKVVLASGNAGKLRELQALLGHCGLEVCAQTAWSVPPVDEPHPTFIENALVKARHASAWTGLPALADDSGLCVAALQSAPGVRSARWAKPNSHGVTQDQANNAKLVSALQAHEQRAAYFYCVLVFVRFPGDPQPLIAEGTWFGEIIDSPRGAAGFGYDPHFYLPEHGCTSAELAPDHKNRISHRARAMQGLLEKIQAAGPY
jgi:XTP/dITP diphosphohydrolase